MPADAELSEVVALMAAAATATGRPLDDPLLAADAAKLAAVALGSSLGQWLGLMRNRPAEGDDDNALRLQRYTVDQVVSVQAIQRDGAMSAKAQIVTRAMRDGEMREEKPMTTEFLDDPIAKEVAGRAKALIGHPAVVYRHNEAAPKGYRAKHGDNAGEVVTQFRRIVWIDAADPVGARKLAARDAGHSTRLAVPPRSAPETEAPAISAPMSEAAEFVQRASTPTPAPQVRQPDPTPEPVPQATLAVAQPSQVVVDERPADQALLAIAEMLTDDELGDHKRKLSPDVVAAYRTWFTTLARSQGRLRALNKDAAKRGEGVASIHDAQTVGDLLRVVNLTGDLLAEQGAPA